MPAHAIIRTIACDALSVTVQIEIQPADNRGSGQVHSRIYQWSATDGYYRYDDDHDALDGTEASLVLDEQASYGDRGLTRTVILTDASPA